MISLSGRRDGDLIGLTWREVNHLHASRCRATRPPLRHSSLHIERSYVPWIVRVHGRRSRDRLFPAEPKVEAFRTDLAVHGHVTPATPHQTTQAPVLLDEHVLTHMLQGRIHAVPTDNKLTVPVVTASESVAAGLARMDGTVHDSAPATA